MRSTLKIVAVVGLVAAVAACGDEHEAAETTAAPSTAAATTTTTASATDLAALLLDVSDVGEGWNASTDLSPQDLGTLGDSPCPDAVINPTIADRLTPTSGVQFGPSDGSKRGIQEVVLSGDVDRLDRDLQAIFGAATDVCMGVESTTADAEKVRYDPLTIPELGDQRMASTWTASEPPDYQVTWRGHTAIVRVGSVAIRLTQFDILPSPEDKPVMDDAAFVQLLQTAVDKLSG